MRGEVGGSVRITCRHANAQSNVKYFCRGVCGEEDVLITSSTTGAQRYSIQNDGNTFYTTIRDLRLEDTGTYWCGVDRTFLDTYVEVYLKVVDGEKIRFYVSPLLVYFDG